MRGILGVLSVVSFTLTMSSVSALNFRSLDQMNFLMRLICGPRQQRLTKKTLNGCLKERSPWTYFLCRRNIQSVERTENQNEFKESLFGRKKAEVDSFIHTVMRCKDVPGIAVAVVKEGDGWTEGYGVGDVKKGVAVGRGTLFGVGSVTKAFTAALLAIAMEEVNSLGGGISWQTKVKELVSGNLELARHLQDKVTLEDILAHRTGIMAADIMAVAGFPADMARAQFVRNLRVLRDILPFRFGWHYNNWIYSLASDVIEYLLADKWETLLKERLLLPLGMKDSLLVWNDINVTSSKMARPYHKIRGSLRELDASLFDLRQGKSAGALAVSADDMAKWMKFLLQNEVLPSGHRLLSEGMLKDLTTSHISLNATHKDVPVGDMYEGYGFGWFTGSYRGKHTVSHTGGWFGYQCTLTLFPEEKMAVYVATNGPGTSAGSDAYRAISYFLSDLALGYTPWLKQSTACAFGNKAGNQTVDPDMKDADLTRIQNPGRYIGKYSNPFLGEVVITSSSSHQGLTLQFQRLEGFLIPREKDREFHVQYTGATEFYSTSDFEVQRSRLSFSRPSSASGGKCPSLVLRAPPPEDFERLEFTREE